MKRWNKTLDLAQIATGLLALWCWTTGRVSVWTAILIILGQCKFEITLE